MKKKGFDGELSFLSNFYECSRSIVVDDIEFNNVESAYQYSKCYLPEDKERMSKITDPKVSKRLGKRIKVRPDWNEVKLQIIEDLVHQKFHDPFLLVMLHQTGNQNLEETNWWGDTFWGVCKGVGENHLGKILMKLRDRVTQFLKDTEDDPDEEYQSS